jgi:predicted nucleic acid-binding protein
LSWLLDADVLSQPAKRRGDALVIAWLEREEPRCYTSTIVVFNPFRESTWLLQALERTSQGSTSRAR